MADGSAFRLRTHASFAGIGGACCGMKSATGYSPISATNHDDVAIGMHRLNHPETIHFCEDVFEVDPVVASEGVAVDAAWFSPDCTHHSRAKGGKPKSNVLRGLAWVVKHWAESAVAPRVIFVENVPEFAKWGPLDEAGQPIKAQEGDTFREWIAALRACGYVVEWRCLKAHHYGAPTSRERIFVIARRDGLPIVWPKQTHGPGLTPYRTAAECIDWSIPTLSIFATPEEARAFGKANGRGTPKRPLAEKTLARIARGLFKFVINNARPFIVPVTHGGEHGRVHDIDEPMRTVTGAHRGEFALVAPVMVQTGYGERVGQAPRVLDLDKPLGVIVGCGQRHGLATAFIERAFSDRPTGGWAGGRQVDLPLPTVTAKDHNHLVVSHLTKLKGTCLDGQALTEPMATVGAQGTHLAEVRAFLVKFYGSAAGADLQLPLDTVTSKDRFGLVMVGGEQYQIVDIGFRMLTPRELARAQGFPDSYALDGFEGHALTTGEQVRLVGNSVPPAVAEALVRANLGVVVPSRFNDSGMVE